MAVNKYIGDDGAISIQAPSNTDTPGAAAYTNLIGLVTQYSLEQTLETSKASLVGSSTQETIRGGKTGTCTLTAWLDMAASENLDEILATMVSGVSGTTLANSDGQIQLNLYYDKHTAGSRKVFSFKAELNRWSISVTGGANVTTVDMTLDVVGEIVHTLAAA